MPTRKNVNKDFFKTWTPDMAYVLGFFAADGSMLKNKRGACFIEFQITDICVLKKIKKALGSDHKISSRQSKKNPKWKTLYRLQIGSKEIFNDLVGLGFTQAKTKTIKVPDIPVKVTSHFIRGYFDGDGCVYFKRHRRSDNGKLSWFFSTHFTSGCEGFLKTLWKILNKSGIEGGYLYKKERGHELVFSRRDSLALYGFMYNNSGYLCLRRKKDIFEKAFKTLGYKNAVVV